MIDENTQDIDGCSEIDFDLLELNFVKEGIKLEILSYILCLIRNKYNLSSDDEAFEYWDKFKNDIMIPKFENEYMKV